jgi:hypothetical protein
MCLVAEEHDMKNQAVDKNSTKKFNLKIVITQLKCYNALQMIPHLTFAVPAVVIHEEFRLSSNTDHLSASSCFIQQVFLSPTVPLRCTLSVQSWAPVSRCPAPL